MEKGILVLQNKHHIKIEYINGILFIKDIQRFSRKHTHISNFLIVMNLLNGRMQIITSCQYFIYGLVSILSQMAG